MEDRRFIEETFPVKEVSEESVREKGIRHGHISTLHVWWARRPLASSRATIFAALIPAPKTHEESTRIKRLVIDLSRWENSIDKTILDKARKEITIAANGGVPKVLDPFAGGGAIPLEALRLGCETYASDYNPVATLMLKCTLEYPQDFLMSDGESQYGLASDRVGNPLVDAVSKWSDRIFADVKKELAKYYPEREKGSVPVGYVWARTVNCQNPSCNAEIPLLRQLWLARKSNMKVSLYPYVRAGRVEFKIVGDGYDRSPEGFNPANGTVSKAVGKCLVCGSIVDDTTMRRLFADGKSGQRMVVVVFHQSGSKGKKFRVARKEDVDDFSKAAEQLKLKRETLAKEWGVDPVPDEPLPPKETLGFRVQRYGMLEWGDLFNQRQKLSLIVFAEKLRVIRDQIEGEGEERGRAVVSYLALGFDKLVSASSVLSKWKPTSVQETPTLGGGGRQSLSMTWDYFELNPISGIGMSWPKTIDVMLDSFRILKETTRPAIVKQNSALSLPYPDNYFDGVFTDPPYYDNVPYSHLSDFFYVWLKRLIGQMYPELFVTPLSPKESEIVAYSHGEGGFEGGKAFFEEMLGRSFVEINRVLRPGGIAVIVYAHKSTAGWETLINSLLSSGLVVTAAWPIQTEMRERLRAKESAALGSSIYMVARKISKYETGFYREVRQELRDHLNRKLDGVWAEGVHGADFFISAIGSAIEVFGKYCQVLDDEGNVVRADRLIEEVRRIVTDYAVKQVLHNGFASEIKPMTRLYVLWRWAYGDEILEFDDARKLGQSVGIDIAHEWGKGFIRKDKEFVRVLGPEDRNLDGLDNPTELIDVMHRVLLLWRKGKHEEITKVLQESGYGRSDVFYRVAQAISESLQNESKEKKLLEGFLSGKERVVKEVKKEASQTRLFE